MKIAEVSTASIPIHDKMEYGGAEIICKDVCDILKEEHDITLFAPVGSKLDGIEVTETVVPDVAWGKEQEAFEVYKDLLIDFDVVHTHDHHYMPFNAPHKAIVHTCHGLQTKIPDNAYNLVTLSNFHRELTLQNFGKDSKVVPNCIDLDKYKPNYDKKDYFLNISLMLEHKNALAAIEACAKAGVHLKVAGEHEFGCDPYYVDRVRKSCERHGFEFLGRVSTAEKIKLLGEAKAVILPFTMPEAHSLLLMEANACGTPVIASKIGGIPEILEKGVNGLMCTGLKDLTKNITYLITYSYLASKKCRQYAEKHFDRKRMAQDYLDLFEKAIKGERW